jgi:ribosomal-protein-serine acetyltransferase
VRQTAAVLPLELSTGLRLRLLEEADADELFALVDANRAHLEPWMPWVPSHTGPAAALEFIRATRRQFDGGEGFQAAIVEEGRIVGVIGFHTIDRTRRATSIGYWLAADRQGHGIMTAAVRALVDHAFGVWRLERVEIRAAPANARSRAIPERLGFRRVGLARRAERHGNRLVDLVVYSLQADAWRAARDGR